MTVPRRRPDGPHLHPDLHSLPQACGQARRGTGRNWAAAIFHLHLVSDATGETLIAVSRAAAAQYQGISAIEHVYPLVRNATQLDRVVSELEAAPGIVLYTLVEPELGAAARGGLHASIGCPCLSVLEPVLSLFQSYLGTRSTQRPGAQHVLDAEYFRRIDALNFTMVHDDGQLPDDLESADVVLVGISRTSKTPTSIYLANRGIKTANIPLVPGDPAAAAAANGASKPLVVGLVASPERIVQIRQNRLLALQRAGRRAAYVDRDRDRRGDRLRPASSAPGTTGR